VEKPIGMMPSYDDLNWTGLEFSPASFDDIMTVDPQAALQEADDQRASFDDFGDRLPAELETQRQAFKARLERSV
jgi:phosphoenolpyruvate carboxykinase (GTP)